MFELMYQQMQISYAEKINRFIYTIKRIPFFGKYIPEEFYARISLKRTLAVFIGILSLIEDIFYKFIYFFGAVLMEVIIIAAKLEEDKFVFDEAGIMIFWIFFFMNFLLGSFVNSRICACDENDYLMVGLLRIDARKYFLIKMFKSQITQIIYYTVFMLVAQHIFDGNIKTTLLYMSGFAAFRFIGEALRLYLNDRFGMPFTDKNKVLNVLYNAYVGIMLFAAYGIPFILLFTKYVLEYNVAVFPDISVIAANPAFLSASVMLAIASIRYIVTYKNYPFVAKRLAGFNTIMQQKTVAENVSKVNKDVEADDLTEKETGKRIFEEKQGYEYLNAIFFERHKRIFSKPRKIKTVISFILMAAGIVAIFIFKAGSTAKEFNAFADDLWKAMDNIITILVFIMYCITSGRNITKALFYNCDHSLLKYGYYRKPEAILKNFRIRLRFMLKNELPMVLVLCVGFVIDTFLLGKIDQWAKLLSIIGCIVLLSIFYSVIYLCMYYIFQPYTEGGKETGVGYSICKGVIYIASYSCLQIDTIPQYFVSIVLVVTVAGLIAGYALAYLMAPKHFVLK